MVDLLIGKDTTVITMLLLFITGLLTKRIVPWYVHDEALKKLQKYEDAAPGLIEEVTRLMDALDQRDAAFTNEEGGKNMSTPNKRPQKIATNRTTKENRYE